MELSTNPRDWAPIVERVTFQWFYRQLGMVNLPMGLDVISQAIDILVKEKGYGTWRWLVEGRALVWEDVPVDSIGKVHAYVVGGATRQKNSVFIRQGFWKMYFLETALKTFDRLVLSRVMSGPRFSSPKEELGVALF